MSVWFAIPSARPSYEATKCLEAWRALGYKIAIWVDACCQLDWAHDRPYDRIQCRATYPGYAHAVNSLVKEILENEPAAEWIVTGGDDTLPDPKRRANEIAAECSDHFEKLWMPEAEGYSLRPTFGVMQPTGDRFAGGHIDRICGSPWMGREFCLRVNAGQGPLWSEYTHMFVDEELQHVATKLGVLWQRRDLVHLHRHFTRVSDALDSNAAPRQAPEFLREANSPAHWAKYDALFKSRRAAGFPGHEPLPVEVAA